MQRKKAGIVIFDDVEVLDFCGPFEVFSVTRLDGDKHYGDPVTRVTAHYMEYPYPESNARRVTTTST